MMYVYNVILKRSTIIPAQEIQKHKFIVHIILIGFIGLQLGELALHTIDCAFDMPLLGFEKGQMDDTKPLDDSEKELEDEIKHTAQFFANNAILSWNLLTFQVNFKAHSFAEILTPPPEIDFVV